MGQSMTKQMVPKLEKLMKKQESNIVNEVLQEIKQKEALAAHQKHKFTDPNALYGGFRRGEAEGPFTQYDLEQQQFLASQSSNGVSPLKQKSSNAEAMPNDLIQFLNEIGPAQKKVDDRLTSSRIINEIEKSQQNQEEYFEKEAIEKRNLHRYSLSSNNLQSFLDDPLKEKKSSRIQRKSITESMSDEEITALLLEEFKKENEEEKKNKTHELIKQYISLPVYMIDSDDDLVAAWEEDVPDLEKSGLKRLKQ